MEISAIISSGLLELYATGAATESEVATVEQWIADYPEVRAELDSIEKLMESYAFAYAMAPTPGLKTNILDTVFPQASQVVPVQTLSFSQEKRYAHISPVWKYLAAASILLLMGSVVLNFTWYNRLQKTEFAYTSSKTELASMHNRMEGMDEDMQVVKNKYSMPVALQGLAAAPEAAAKVFWMKNSGEVYIDPSNLPAIPAGMQYQLWGIVDGKPVDAGLIITTTADKKYRIQKMKSFGKSKVEAFAVTLETAGGNPTPKGDMYVMGKM